jgi:WD40 repeat protein
LTPASSPQVFLRGHDDDITCLALSPSGRFVASGQKGENSDAIVFDFESKQLLYRMSEHDFGVACLAFSDDELLLCTVGSVDDNKILVRRRRFAPVPFLPFYCFSPWPLPFPPLLAQCCNLNLPLT